MATEATELQGLKDFSASSKK